MMRMNMEGDSHVGESHVQAAASAVIVELRGSVRYDIYSMIPKYCQGFMCLPPLHSLGQSNKREISVSDNLQLTYRNALVLAYVRARSYLEMDGPWYLPY
jgi:hypothetical protein